MTNSFTILYCISSLIALGLYLWIAYRFWNVMVNDVSCLLGIIADPTEMPLFQTFAILCVGAYTMVVIALLWPVCWPFWQYVYQWLLRRFKINADQIKLVKLIIGDKKK